MGDRCYLSMTVHPDDLKKAAWLEWLSFQGEDEEGDAPHDWAAGECNYALQDARLTLAAGSVRFVGSHSEGGDYSAGIFYSDGQEHYDWACDSYDNSPAIAIRKNQLDPAAVQACNHFLSRQAAIYEAIRAAIEKLPKQ